jgi:hypothetical protein
MSRKTRKTEPCTAGNEAKTSDPLVIRFATHDSAANETPSGPREETKMHETLKLGLMAGVVGLALQAADPSDARADGKPHPDRDEACQSLKLRAVGDYYTCLLRAGDDPWRREGCDNRFERNFSKADRLSPACPPLDDPDRTQRAVADQAQAVLVGDVSTPPCQQIVSGADGLVTCLISAPSEYITTTVASLSDILTQIQTQSSSSCADCASVTADTPLWLQAWGAPGGSRFQGLGGAPGFAQTVTTINELEMQGIVDLYYYFGQTGGYNQTSGASGGTATLVTTVDLQRNPATPPTSSGMLLIAGGGGGSGGCDGGCILSCPTPGNGGAGGVAISTVGPDGQGIGQGGDGSWTGSGGGEGVGGSSASNDGGPGNDGIGGTGGPGSFGAGGHSQNGTTWFNTGSTPLTFSSGGGGGGGYDSNSCTAGGGGGGGGWGGGGGGIHGNNNYSAGGGGGGGSWSAPSTCNDVTAPTTYPGNNSTGHANLFLVFNTQGTCQ